MGHWNKDWMQGPYPRTPEERAAAAKKYGLRPEHYEPCEDDGVGWGDYPKLPIVHYDQREPEADYEFYDAKSQRYYGEPINKDQDVWNFVAANRDPKWHIWNRLDYGQKLKWYFMMPFFLFIWMFFYGDDIYAPRCPVDKAAPKQYVRPGWVHYSFEPADS